MHKIMLIFHVTHIFGSVFGPMRVHERVGFLLRCRLERLWSFFLDIRNLPILCDLRLILSALVLEFNLVLKFVILAFLLRFCNLCTWIFGFDGIGDCFGERTNVDVLLRVRATKAKALSLIRWHSLATNFHRGPVRGLRSTMTLFGDAWV